MAADIVSSFELPPINSFDIQKKVALERSSSISQNLFCSQCHDYFKNPKILPCLHFFCEDCIHNHMVRNNEITCNRCNESTSTTKISELMTHNPMADLIQLKQLREKVRKNPREVYCMNCSFGDSRPKAPGKYYCCDCKEIMCLHDKVAHDKYKNNHRSILIEDFKEEEEVANLLSNISTLKCKKHTKQDIKYFCVECEQHICDDCQFEDHNTHKKTFLEAALNLFSDSVDKKMEMFGSPVKEMSEEVNQMEENLRLMANRQKETIERITKHFNEIMQGIEKRRDTLIGNVNVWYSNLRNQVFSSCRKQNELLEKIGTLADFVSSYKNYPNSYKIELTSVTTKRFNRLYGILPKVPLKIKTIGYEKGADNEFKIDNIGFLKYENRTCFEAPIKQISREELVPKNVNHFEVDEKDPEFKTYAVQGIAGGYHDNLYVFTSEFDQGATDRFVKDGFQILDANCNITQTLNWSSILKKPTQILIGRENQVYILDAIQKHIIIRNQSFNRTIRAITADDSNEISDPSSIALTSSFDLVVHNRQSNQLIILQNEDFSLQKKLQLKTTQVKRKESPTSISRTDSKIRSGDRERKDRKAPIPEKDRKSPLKEPMVTGSITLAINSKDYIYVASEDRALITIYNLEGKEIDEIDFQERLKNLEEKETNERKASFPESDSGQRQARKTATLPNKSSPPVLSKRASTIKPLASNARSPSPTNTPSSSAASKTLLKIDSLDNIYVYQKNFILMFDPQNKYSASAKIGPSIDPVSIHANSIGHVYVLSEKGELHVFN